MSTPSIVIRPERPDHPQVRELLRQLDVYLASLYEPEDNHILDERELLAPDVTFLVAADEESIVGCGAVRRMPAEADTQQRPYGEVKRMMVDPRLRGQRIGARLLQALEALLRTDRIELALLETGAQQTEAVRLYERNGYRRRATFGGYPDNGLSVFYEKSLSQ
ncbi:MAG TPA: GNAT family N-acetyltransferase [Burkholderiaceae bacterium]|nr:GNAT family N-acetyltransferase [Burkholderiaceae bacterium]